MVDFIIISYQHTNKDHQGYHPDESSVVCLRRQPISKKCVQCTSIAHIASSRTAGQQPFSRAAVAAAAAEALTLFARIIPCLLRILPQSRYIRDDSQKQCCCPHYLSWNTDRPITHTRHIQPENFVIFLATIEPEIERERQKRAAFSFSRLIKRRNQRQKLPLPPPIPCCQYRRTCSSHPFTAIVVFCTPAAQELSPLVLYS